MSKPSKEATTSYEGGSDLSYPTTNVSATTAGLLSSLAADVATLKQIASLNVQNDDSEALRRLVQLETSVSDLESKMRVLREVVQEEQGALQHLETLVVDAKRTQETLEQCVLQTAETRAEQENQVNETKTTTATTKIPTDVDKLRRDSMDPRRGLASTINTTLSSSYQDLHLERIKPEQLQMVPKTIRGRIPLNVLNEALLQIERVVREKYAHKRKHKSKQFASYQYKQQQTIPSYPDPWISEHELRQSCAFFRSGESTARAVLATLRHLSRLSQVPKNGDAIYVCVPMK